MTSVKLRSLVRVDLNAPAGTAILAGLDLYPSIAIARSRPARTAEGADDDGLKGVAALKGRGSSEGTGVEKAGVMWEHSPRSRIRGGEPERAADGQAGCRGSDTSDGPMDSTGSGTEAGLPIFRCPVS